MPVRVPQSSGHTIYSAHIEEPKREFYVAFDAPPYVNVLLFEGGPRWVRVLAETPEGAVQVARYHYYTGDNFELLPRRPGNRKESSMEPKDALNADLITALREVATIEAVDPDGMRYTWKDLAIMSAVVAHKALQHHEIKTAILEALNDGKLHTTVDLVQSLSELGEGNVKKALLDLADRYVVSLQKHNWPANPTFGDVGLMPSDKVGNVYIAAFLRDEKSVSLGDSLTPELVSSLQKIAGVEATGQDEGRRSWKEIASGSIDTAKEAIARAESFSLEKKTTGAEADVKLIYAERIENDTGEILDRGIFRSIEEFAPHRAAGWSGVAEENTLTDEWLQKQASGQSFSTIAGSVDPSNREILQKVAGAGGNVDRHWSNGIHGEGNFSAIAFKNLPGTFIAGREGVHWSVRDFEAARNAIETVGPDGIRVDSLGLDVMRVLPSQHITLPRSEILQKALSEGAKFEHFWSYGEVDGRNLFIVSFRESEGTYIFKDAQAYYTRESFEKVSTSMEVDKDKLPGIYDLKPVTEIKAGSPARDLSFMDSAPEAPEHARTLQTKFESSDPDHSFGF
ncbi:MAG: hypothetical protein MOB07_14035 [Acidobacteria bacterium]|nr:hypothetical protein [Acidobacteriota bacterium]